MKLARATAVFLLVTACTAPDQGRSVQALETPWTARTIYAGLSGADGVNLKDVNADGLFDVVTPWEQSAKTTVSLHPGYGGLGSEWPTTIVGTSLGAVEDAIFADVDDDGNVDVITASENKKIYIHFAPTPPATTWTTVIVASATGTQRWMQVAFADIDDDGHGDIIAGGRTAPATVSLFKGPSSPDDPRDGADWARTDISNAGWVMSLKVLDVDADDDLDIVLSDRTHYLVGGVPTYDLVGSRWLEQVSWSSWTNHTIGVSAGDPKFLEIADLDGDSDLDVIDCSSNNNYQSITRRLNGGGWTSWTSSAVSPLPSNVGQCQDVAVGDLDQDSYLDYVVSYSAADGALSGIVWISGADGSRNEVSGEPGVKFDNVELYDVDGDSDLDIITSEQTEGLGIVSYENELVAAAPDAAPPAPDANWCMCPCP